MGRRFLIGAATVFALTVSSGAGFLSGRTALAENFDKEIQDHKSQLEALRKQAEAKRQLARRYAKEEKSVIGRLSKAEEAINATQKYLRKLEERESTLEADIRDTGRRLDLARRDLDEKREALRSRIRHVYIHGRARSLEVLFSAGSFPDLLQRGAFLSRVLQGERKLVGEVEERQRGVERSLSELQKKKNEIRRLQSEKSAEKQEYEGLRKKREQDLTKVRNQRTEHEQAARELEQAASQLKEVLAELERRRVDSMRRDDPILTELDRQNFSGNRGRLPWPVTGDVISGFGPHKHPKYKTVTLNNGIDIGAPHGAAVQSVGDGVVDMVRWLSGYGLSVIINHGRGYYTIYSHLSAAHTEKGDRVEPGQIIGSVGDSGSLKGTCLHFELREGSQAQDPRQWLR